MSHSSLLGTGQCVCFQLRRASRAITQLYDAALQPAGIRSTQFALLVAVAKKEPITISELGGLLVIDSTTLSRSLRKLEQMVLLKVVSGSDRRQRLVKLTAKGWRVLEKSVPYWKKVQAEVISGLTQVDWAEIQTNLQDLKDVSQQVFEQRSR